MTRVLHIIDAAAPAGALAQLSLLAGPTDETVSVGPPPAAALRAGPVEAVHRPMGSPRLAAMRLRRRAEGFDLLHAWSADALLAGRELSLAAGLPMVASLQVAGTKRRAAAVAEAVGPGLLTVTVPTRADRAALLAAGLPPARARVLPPAAAPPADRAAARRRVRTALGLADTRRLVAAPDALTRPAGGDLAAWAYAIVRQVRNGAALLFPGEGPAAEHVRSFARTTGYESEVFFTGLRFTTAETLAAADLAGFFHRRNAGPAGLAAAMAAGRPIAASGTPEIAELAPADKAALLVTPGDPRQAAAALLALLEDAGLAARLGQAAARRAAEQFAPTRVRQRLDAVYEETVQAKVF